MLCYYGDVIAVRRRGDSQFDPGLVAFFAHGISECHDWFRIKSLLSLDIRIRAVVWSRSVTSVLQQIFRARKYKYNSACFHICHFRPSQTSERCHLREFLQIKDSMVVSMRAALCSAWFYGQALCTPGRKTLSPLVLEQALI